MAVDLTDSDKRKNYLAEKLDDLLDGINESYGVTLMEELISRLEATVNEFNDEVNSLMEQLKEIGVKREELLEKIKSGEDEEEKEEEEVSEAKDEDQHEMSAWEKRLEEMEKK
ncbi:MAG: hypothetical protein QF613_03035 [Candidatus Marinimicrobia bacterium]|jgi:predicted  nucleic acid-binding Zn-ribbon protein|nr:hypothetical protein [Candidatus Neomarinimicrobiota bacterium]MDP6593169.1 hypothetical protein [Candidatus Neomarinimicrobiota bacterium]MDP6836026.1 hypothetical protein [Candidatus Neomarinimicrobiota bacterium]MDP6967462.1 hypothetical protein [Candidatus Neomarinimicrobiota bacterium]|tara:strand:- start:7595 stop:7933 length:339 start_codon:yes stop_codon:yes gene_type:complete